MDTKLKTGERTFTPDFRMRPAQWADLHAVAQLMYEVWEDDGDTTMAATPEDLMIQWQKPGFDLEHDTFVVETSDRQIVGYDQFDNQFAHAIVEAEGFYRGGIVGAGGERRQRQNSK